MTSIVPRLTVLFLCSFSSQLLAADNSWLLTYRDKNTNQLAWDERFKPFLKANLPSAVAPFWDNHPFDETALEFLGGPPDDILIQKDRYVVASACVAHDCLDKGLLWVDLDPEQGNVVFVALYNAQYNPNRSIANQYPINSCDLYFASNSKLTPDSLPDHFKDTVIKWLHVVGALQVNKIDLLNSGGVDLPVTTEQLGWKRMPMHRP